MRNKRKNSGLYSETVRNGISLIYFSIITKFWKYYLNNLHVVMYFPIHVK